MSKRPTISRSETPPPYDAWAIACLIAGKDIDIDYRRISAANRDAVRIIAEASFDDRAGEWKQYVACALSEAEGDALIKAVAAVNLDDPLLDDDGGQFLAVKSDVEDDGRSLRRPTSSPSRSTFTHRLCKT